MKVKADYSIRDIQKITGIGNNKAYTSTFHGEYYVGKKRLIRRDEFDYRRKMGLDVCINN
jgi:hypothetical protein